MQQQNQNFNELLEGLKQAVMSSMMDDKNLWTSERCATYLGYSVRYFRRSIATLKGFPNPIILPTAAARGGERWEPKEVKAWAERFRRG
ncbi:hypothetical protein [Neisseria wadsworthii]|nr:hypothetical protein [Neisseria wadsworthii]QMT34816.1 hypothetical protein H3L96_06940 [Neisseria wadsworthii]